MTNLKDPSPHRDNRQSGPSFSVIVPTCHRNDLLEKCLQGLGADRQSLSTKRYEVIVTDDGSRTTAARMIQQDYPWTKWVSGPRKGPAANRNNGARYAREEWLAFVDDDCIPDPQWLEAYAEAIVEQPACQIFEGTVYADRPRQSLGEIAPVFAAGGNLPSGNFVCRKSIFESLGGFDERFPYPAMEDIDLRLRVEEANHAFSLVELAAVSHPWRPKGGWQHLQRHQDSTFIFLSIHPQETARIISAYSLKAIWNSLRTQTIPGLIRFRGRGIEEAFLEHVAAFQMRHKLSRSATRS